MKVKTLALAAGVGALAFAGTASASLLGWSVDIETVSFNGNTYDVHRFFADYEPGANAQILGAGSIQNSVSSFGTSDPNGFWSAAGMPGYTNSDPNFAPSEFMVDFHGDPMRYTSFLTIGRRAAQGQGTLNLTPGAFGLPSDSNVWQHAPTDGSIDDPHVIGNNELIFTADPFNPHTTAQWSFDNHGEWRVMLLQLTIGEGEKLNVSNWRFESTDHNTGQITVGEINFQSATVPAPGALALLGLAGLVGVRRRR